MLSKGVKTVLWLYLSWVLFWLLLVMPAVNLSVPRLFEQYTGRPFQFDLIVVDPFRLAVSVRRGRIPEHNGETFVSFELTELNLSLASLWRRGWVFDRVTTRELAAHTRLLRNRHWNFQDMIPGAHSSPRERANDNRGIPALTINHLRFHSRRLSFSDENRPETFTTHLEGFSFDAYQLSTIQEDGKDYALTARDESGAELAWHGTISIPSATSRGRVVLDHISLSPLWRYISPRLLWRLNSGTLHWETDYQISWAEGFEFLLERGKLILADLAVSEIDRHGPTPTYLELASVELAGIGVNGSTRSAQAEALTVSGLDLAGWSQGRTISIVELFTPRTRGTQAQADRSAAQPPADNWTVSINEIQLNDSQLAWHDTRLDPAQVSVDPLELSLQRFSWPGKTAFQLELNASLNQHTALAMAGEYQLQRGEGHGQLAVHNLPLSLLNPNLKPPLLAKIRRGQLNASARLALAEHAPLTLQSDIQVREFALAGVGASDPAGGWQALSVEQLAVDFNQRTITAQNLLVDGFHARMHIATDGKVNLRELVALPDDSAASPQQQASTAEPPPSIDWQVHFPHLQISNSNLDFRDSSMALDFHSAIRELEGNISQVSNLPGQALSLRLAGKVDDYAPVLLSGSGKPAAPRPSFNLGFAFQGIDLSHLNPYTDTYMGREIDSGLMTLDLNYQLDGRRLKGDNNILIDKLKLGAKTLSEKAANLPLDLAIALLTDANGIISLEVPVSGELDDPKFDISSVIWKAFTNLIIKAATAPFKLLAGLIGSDSDLETLLFRAGETNPDVNAHKVLDDLALALNQRPTVKLGISGYFDPVADRLAIQQAELTARLLAAGLPEAELVARGEPWVQVVTNLYRQDYGEPKPETSAEDLYKILLARVAVDIDRLSELAQERAVSCKRYLVNDKLLPADRIFLQAPPENEIGSGLTGVRMTVDF